MHSKETQNIPDLIVGRCPVDDCSHCAMIYINTQIGHRIICRCICHSLAEYKIEKESTTLQGALQVGSHGERQAAMLDPSCVVNNTDSTEVQEVPFIDAV